jgi:hypothetical protein
MSDVKKISWSHSRIDDFKRCARMFYEKNIAKTVPFEQTAPMLEGDRVHKMLDKRIRSNEALSIDYQHLEPLVQSILRAPGQTFAEQKMTINDHLSPTGWFSDDAYCRIIVDVMKINGEMGFMGDWKTGKPKFDDHQLKLFAAVGFEFFPSLVQITTAYIWLKTKMLDPKVYTRADLPRMWEELLVEPTRLQDYANRNYWPERPGNHCKYCGVNKQRRCTSASEPYRGS